MGRSARDQPKRRREAGGMVTIARGGFARASSAERGVTERLVNAREVAYLVVGEGTGSMRLSPLSQCQRERLNR